MVELNDVSFSYGGSTILETIDLKISKGEFVSVLGESGTGKSTLLRVVAGLEKQYSGKVSVRADSLGVVFQDYSLFPWLSLIDNIIIALEEKDRGKSRQELRKTAEFYLETVGLGSALKKLPRELSGGMRQRGAIARMLALGSDLFLMDEPFGALDSKNRRSLQELLSRITTEQSKTVLFVTHDIEEAILLSDRVVVLAGVPAGVRGVIKVPFGRPRLTHKVINDENFTRLKTAIYDLLTDSPASVEVLGGERYETELKQAGALR